MLSQLKHIVIIPHHLSELLLKWHLAVLSKFDRLPFPLLRFLFLIQFHLKVVLFIVSFYNFEEILHERLSQRSADGSGPIWELFDSFGTVVENVKSLSSRRIDQWVGQSLMDHVEYLHWLVLMQIQLKRFDIHYQLRSTLAQLQNFGNLYAVDALSFDNLCEVVALVTDHRFDLSVGMLRVLNALVNMHESQVHLLLQL